MMNHYQQNLYDDLMSLQTSDAFYYIDQTIGSGVHAVRYRIFNYRLASYTDFCNPVALESRGIMFKMSPYTTDLAVELASLPMEKFFNLHENPFTMNMDLSSIDCIMLKADGSLISTYLHDGELRLKTKGSLLSVQAQDAMEFLQKNENATLRLQLQQLATNGFTINMEWCAPNNRIVVGYMEPSLTILNIRQHSDGSYIDLSDIAHQDYNEIHSHWIKMESCDKEKEWVTTIPSLTGIEGFVLRVNTKDGCAHSRKGNTYTPIQHVKIKTEWYLVQHRAKDSITNPRRLYEAVIEEATDDLRTLFHDDPVVIKTILQMEERVEKLYNHIVDSVEQFYEANKHLERKEYAILGQRVISNGAFSLAMMKYIGRQIDYKEWMKKQWKTFGIKDLSEKNV